MSPKRLPTPFLRPTPFLCPMMRTAISYCFIILMVPFGVSCGRDAASGLKGQSNTTVTFYGKVVDQDGKPLKGARFEYRVEAYPADWTFDTRGRDNVAWKVSAISNGDGLFEFKVTGCKLIRMKADLEGYVHFCDEETDSRAVDNRFYRLISWSDLCYKSDRGNPAVYVFAKEGAKEVSALPCRGGYDSGNGTHWVLNVPAWPKKPSINDVMYKPASTQPITKASD